MTKNPHAVALGRKGGRVRSEAKKQASKLNMEKARAAKLAKNTKDCLQSPSNRA